MKKLLIVTQKVDKNDAVLGFFHGWIEKFAAGFEKITVICLEKGRVELPQNVALFSLGKENGRSRLKYLKNFYHFIWQERKNYDVIFVHMNQEYVILGAPFWFFMGKRITMWRNHPAGNFLTSLAVFICGKVFCTSKYSYTARFRKTKIMPVGVNTDTFKMLPGIDRKPHSILFLGRIAPLKKPDIFIDALKILRDSGEKFSASICGDALPRDSGYYNVLQEKVKISGLADFISFHAAIPNEQTAHIYNEHEIFVNLSPSGMYDKTIFEAALCGALPLNSNKNLVGEIDSRLIFEENSAEDLALKLKNLLDSTDAGLEELRKRASDYATREHSLVSLTKKLTEELSFRRTFIDSTIKWFFGIPIVARYERVIIYLVAGGTAAFVDLVLLFFFTSVLHIWYLISAILAFICAFIVSFILSKFWTFADRSEGAWRAQAVIYFFITGTNLFLNTLLMYIFVDFVHLHYMVAQFITSGLLAFESYFAYQILIFKKKHKTLPRVSPKNYE